MTRVSGKRDTRSRACHRTPHPTGQPARPSRPSRTLFVRGADAVRLIPGRRNACGPAHTEPTCGPVIRAYVEVWTPRAHGADKEPDGLRPSDVVDPSRARSRLSTLTVACGVWRVARGSPGLTGLRRNHPPVDWHVPKGRPVPGCPHDRVTVRAHNARVTGASLAPQPSPTFCHADPVAKHGINRWG